MHRGAPVGMAGRRCRHGAQGVAGPTQVGQRGGVQPVADRTPGAVDLVGLGVDLGPAGRGIQRRRLAELECEVQPLAQQQHGVGLRQHLGKGAQAGVGHAARAFHADDGHAQRGFQRSQAGAAGARQRRGAGQDQRPFRPLQARQQVARAGFGQRLRGRHEGVGRRQRRGLGRAFQRVAGQAQVHRAGPAAAGRLHRSRQVGGYGVGAGAGPGGLAHRRGHVGLAHFLEGAHAALAVRGVAGQQHHRGLGHQRGVQRRHRVGVAGPAGDQGDADLAGQPRPGVGHVHGSGFVAGVDQPDPAAQQRVEDRHDVVAR